MKNKKLIFSIILTTVLVSCSTNNVKALSDTRGLQLSDTQIANNEEHTHTYSTDWSADDLYHWHDSTCEHNLISDKENHSFGDWYTVLNPTEYKVGKEQRECNKCHYIEEKDIPVLEHVHEYSEEWSYDETHHWHESTCGISEKQNYEAHEFGDWVVKKEPRDEIEGLKTRKCNKCDYFESETIEALPHTHSYSDSWTYNETHHWHNSTCFDDTISEYKEHTFDVWIVDVEPTKTSIGEEHSSCYCGYVQSCYIYSINYILNGGANNPLNPEKFSRNSVELTLYSPTKNGYDFIGWKYNEDYVFEIDIELTCNITLEAIWTTHAYSINYETFGGINNPSNPNAYSIESENIMLESPTKTGYDFLGWYDTSSFSNKISSINQGSSGDITLFARWSPTVYSIEYNLNDGVNSTLNPIDYTIESNIIFDKATKTGYTFIGWFDDDGNQINSISPGQTGNITLTAYWNDGDTFTVTLNPDGGSVSQTTISVRYDQNYSLPEPTKLGYDFLGWYDGSTKIDSTSTWNFTSDKTFIAKWSAIKYSITYVLNGGTCTSNPHYYTIINEHVFYDPTRTGYTFLGWFDENGNQITAISVGQTGDITLIAHWNDGDEFTVTLDPDGGSVSQTTISVRYDQNYSLPEPTKLGYDFLGWYDGSTKIDSTSTWNFTSDKTFIAKWKIVYYTITYQMNGGVNNSHNVNLYTVEKSVLFYPPYKGGYKFVGWFYENGNPAYSGFGPGNVGDVVIEARWSAEKNELTVTSNDASKGTVTIVTGSGYSGEEITVLATPANDCIFKGWYDDSHGKISDSLEYTFNMPIWDYSLCAHFVTNAEEEEATKRNLGILPTILEEDQTITYGLYPQELVYDSSLISSLENLSSPESNGWYLYEGNYYAMLVAHPASSDTKFNGGGKVVDGETYWFKCSPISWDVLSNNNGEYYLVSSLLLDAQCYYNSESNREIDNKTIYPNNYEYSDIRYWLNNDFYYNAFSLGDEYIQVTNVENDVSTTADEINDYVCDDTQDKVFLPSYQDYLNGSYGFSTSTSSSDTRACKTTDWAKARGARTAENMLPTSIQKNGYYWTRSPKGDDPIRTMFITAEGQCSLSYRRKVNDSNISVRPALTIKIN